MAYDLVVRDGTIVDGTGLPPFRGDVGIRNGRIVHVGRIREKGDREINAEGHMVTPGFIDGHTHMDAQVFWDPYGTCSSWHGVTTVVMGNCGFTLAPVRSDARELIVRNLERAEDIPAAVMAAGVEWSWEDFPGYLDAVDRLPKAINYAGYVGHSAIRTWAMGERAFTEEASDDDIRAMQQQVRSALDAGALGFSTSRSSNHLTPDGGPVASRQASWDELRALVGVLGEYEGDRIFEISLEKGTSDPDPKVREAVFARLRSVALSSGAPIMFGITAGLTQDPEGYRWRGLLDLVDSVNAAGGRAFGQSVPRSGTNIFSFKNRLPFDRIPQWAEFRSLPLDAQRTLLVNPEARARLVKAAIEGPYQTEPGLGRAPEYDRIEVLLEPVGPNPTLAQMALERGIHPAEALIETSLEKDFDQFYEFGSNSPREEDLLSILKHPNVIMTFSDSGAHVGFIMDSSIQSYLLAYWVRQRQVFSFEEAVRMLTLVPASAWGFTDRGLLRQGFVADLNVIDPDRVGPLPLFADNDLPAGMA
ncbi:MAG TPA: amidohydrolase family protein, partial [Acidimicrobiales bacterium]|nr:amidohydrolase family protein [Acidimicrobiales bacterium]